MGQYQPKIITQGDKVRRKLIGSQMEHTAALGLTSALCKGEELDSQSLKPQLP